jgi:hypothetical protein
METLKTMLFSEMKLGEASIKFEKQQLGFYADLVKRHPENEAYKKTQARLTKLLEDHEKQLVDSPKK